MRVSLGRVVVLAIILVLLGAADATGEPEAPNFAALVVVHGDGSEKRFCVEFSENEISGYELLNRSGLDLGIEAGSGVGTAICRLDGEGCTYPAEHCFCKCLGSTCVYWSYWRLVEDAWQYSSLGASETTVRHGDVDGWVWGEGVIGTSAVSSPPLVSFADICAAQVPTATETATPTETPTATQVTIEQATNTPTNTPTRTFTPTSRPATSTPVPPPPQTPTPGPSATPTNTPIPQPVIVRFGLDRPVVNFGETVTLSWEVVNANTHILRYPGAEESVPAAGSKQIVAERSLLYTLVAYNAAGEARAEANLTVNAVFSAPTAPPTATPSPVPATETATLTMTPLPTDTATPLPPPTDTETPVPVLPTETATPALLEGATEIEAATAAPIAVLPTDTATPIIIVVTATPVPTSTAMVGMVPAVPANDGGAAPPAPAAAAPVSLSREAPPAALEDARMQRLLLIGGLVFVLGTPLLFGAIWFVVWSVWRER